MWNLPRTTRIIDVGLRDGLQAIPEPLPLETKLEIVNRLIDAGVKEIEVCSFAHPKVLPQLADAVDLLNMVPRDRGVRYRGLVPNLKGAQRAAETELDEIAFVVPAEDGMALKNQGKTTNELLDDLAEIGILAHQRGQDLVVAVACAFFSPCHGPVSAQDRRRVIAAAQDAGASGIYLATTTGQEHPRELYSGIMETREEFPDLSVGAHLHNRNGFASANALAALSAGADWLEASFGALGGDLWFPGDPTVLGNMATEDLVHLLDGMGIQTGIDLEKTRDIAELVYSATGFPRSSFVARGGTRKDLAEATWDD
ncbi:hydroxymethylglutaryl-CoA lyase [Cellulosimicrobium funkei]|nr:hydroxymethylglutaryl-CoA lyase [Cellulosimicrobium funkei]